MRTVINISLPPKMAALVKKEVKRGRFVSTSEFFRELLRKWEEEQLLKELQESQKEYKDGKARVLKSLKNLV